MSSISIQNESITRLEVDAIVNAANSGLRGGSGVCGAIFREAGWDKMEQACDAIGGCPTGNAAITPGFDLPSKFVIHAVGPVWSGGNRNEAELLYGAYENSLERAMENDCHSIAFPLISSGIYGYPKRQAWEVALRSCKDFMDSHPDYEIDIIFAVIDEGMLAIGEEIKEKIDW